ncbi:PD-(D/E)XK nuclease family protein [Parabacteroides sp. Marseille-P3160]|uniref:PD-(D/E)XK nuclease family protein n=1 Tax=Parabacteroides sp. Marseille-P3160 TaxID=1917887 RepID=UPI0009B9CAA0|nr:PD-(D/E)XK nuclease family protein [Parabacteroides sp. Marseille-P3160]
MKPFLYQVASVFYREYGSRVYQLAFVFPNRRAGLFFRKYLSEIAGKPVFSPTILTINDLFNRLSGKQPADRIRMLFLLYGSYIRRSGSTESFDEFLYWGEMLLNDFDDVDKYLANARMLFSNVTDLRRIETDFGFLNEKQIAAIRSFWSSFQPKRENPGQQQFLAVWEILYDLYTDLRSALSEEGQGYEGMIYREVVEHLKETGACDLPYPKIVFVGLNALSEVEKTLLNLLQKQGIADFYWDYDSPMAADPENRASHFSRYNLSAFPSAHPLPERETPLPSPEIDLIQIPSRIGQAKQVYSLLEKWCGETGMEEEEALRTAIVLPDEQLLIPVLHSIPEQIRRINVTMGYPLAGTPIASLMEYILALQKNVRYTDGEAAFYFRDVLPVLNHRYISSADPETASRLAKDITERNRVYIHSSELGKTPLLSLLFATPQGVDELSDYLISLLKELNRRMSADSPEEEEVQRMDDLEQEFVYHYYTTVNRLRELIRQEKIVMTIDTYFRLLKRVTDTISIPFQGEPLSGLQIMGVLETRALDFDRLIILSMNEGIFPAKKGANSFIPYNLRRGFDLPTYEHQDSVWAYHFYRLIYRAKQICLLYDTRTNGLQTGEVSRFVHQLRYHYHLPIRDRLVVYQVSSSKVPPITVEKTDVIRHKLEAFHRGGPRALSASAINTYLDCPLKFYFSVIEDIREEEEVNETIESSLFGSILHKVMELLYQRLCGQWVTADLLQGILKNTALLTRTLERAFAEVFFQSKTIKPLTGQNYLIGEMIRKYVMKIIENDCKQTPFRYIESEKRVNKEFLLTDGTPIQLKGFIDRIDEVEDRLRIVDYKTGAGMTRFSSVGSLFDLSEKMRSKAVMQVFMYAWMYDGLREGQALQPTIYYMRTLFSPSFDPAVYQQIDRQKEQVSDFSSLRPEFEAGLRTCLDQIFDATTPFVQTPTGKACAYCPFAGICGK